MRILLLSPLLADYYHFHYQSSLKALLHASVLRTISHKSLALEAVAAVTPKEHQVIIRKVPYDKVRYDEPCDIVGIHCVTGDAPFAYVIADTFRARGVPVVLGGYHPSALPEEAKQHADSVVIGEAEVSWPLLLQDFQQGRLKPFYRQEKPVMGEQIPTPVQNNSKDFSPAVQAARGCPYQCEFCSETIINARKLYRPRPVQTVVEEIQALPGSTFIFHDPSLTINPEYSKQLFSEMAGLKKHFFCNGNADTLGSDEELLELAHIAGCLGWLIGFESLSQEALESVKKKTNQVENYTLAIEKVHEHAMMVCGTFLFGFDTDTPDVFDRTKKFVETSHIDVPDALILTPFPGTPLFHQLVSEGRILTKDWAIYDHKHVVFQPKHMTPEELLTRTYRLYKDFYTVKNIFKRIVTSLNLDYYAFRCVLFSSLTMRNVEFNIATRLEKPQDLP